MKKIEDFNENQSGWGLTEILNLSINISRYAPLQAGLSTFVRLPRDIQKKKAVVNIMNEDHYCFLWSVVAALYPVSSNSCVTSSYPYPSSVLDHTGIKFPIELKDIPLFVKLNDLKINVHYTDCLSHNKVKMSLPSQENKILSFKNHIFKDPVPFVVYADLESIFQSSKSVTTVFKGKIEILPINKEKYIAFTKTVDDTTIHLRFIDSFRFMASSIDKLSSYLTDDSKIIRRQFYSDPEELKLVTSKGIFPYEYVDSLEKLDVTKLPDKQDFYSRLNDKHISDDDYTFAQKVWDKFNIQTLGEYSDLYLKTDVLLLADIFENFRSSCFKTYELDALHYYTALGLAFSAMVKLTGVQLELLLD
ncbi:GSCOCG00011376001-RA-CDS, partial [Cotesia congregata]